MCRENSGARRVPAILHAARIDTPTRSVSEGNTLADASGWCVKLARDENTLAHQGNALIRADDLADVHRADGPPDVQRDRVRHEPDRAVAEEDVDAAGVPAAGRLVQEVIRGADTQVRRVGVGADSVPNVSTVVTVKGK